MEDQRITEALNLLSEIRGLLFQRKRLMERYLYLPAMRILLWVWGVILSLVGVWLSLDGEGFLSLWKEFPGWGVALLIMVALGGISWLKMRAWKVLSPSESVVESLFASLGRALLFLLAVETIVFGVIHVWVILQGAVWYLFPLWAIWVGLVYTMYGVFLSLGIVQWLGGWFILAGLVTLFWTPSHVTQGGVAFLLVFGLPFLVFAGLNELFFRLRK